MSEAGIRSSGHADNHACGNSAHPGGGAAPALAAAAAAPDWDDLTPLGRLEMLCDPGSVQVIRSAVRSNRLGTKPSDGEGVAGASGAIAGRPIFCYAEDGRFAGGSLGPADASTILRILELAGKARAPVVGFVDCAGARLQEGAAALGAYARVFRSKVRLSGKVPQISIVTGSPPAGGCQSPALADFTLMTRSTSMFLAGPPAVRAMPGAQAPAFDLGGGARYSGCQFVVDSDLDAVVLARMLLSYLPQNAWERPVETDPAPPAAGNPGEVVPRVASRVYEVREVARRIVDGGSLLEVSQRRARNMVTAFARLGGMSVGVVANQPRHLAGIIDGAASEKAAGFVATCNAYGIPLVVLVDTPGFMPGTKHEPAEFIRRGATLMSAFIEAEVPKLTVVLRHGYGGGFIAMNCRELGADLAFAWPRARIDYALEHEAARAAARDGVIDELVSPSETRARLIAALEALRAKRVDDGREETIPP